MVDVDKLSQLGKLHEAGVLSDEEFAEAKAQLLREPEQQVAAHAMPAPEEPAVAPLPPYDGDPPVIVPFFAVNREQVAALLAFHQAVSPDNGTVAAIQSSTIPVTLEWSDGILRVEAALRDFFVTELTQRWPSLLILSDGIRTEMRIGESGRALTLLDAILESSGTSWHEFRWLSGLVNHEPAEWEEHRVATLPPSSGKALTPEKLATGVAMVLSDRKRQTAFTALGAGDSGLSVFPVDGGAVRVAVISRDAASLGRKLAPAWPVSGDPLAREPRCLVVDFEHSPESGNGIMTYLDAARAAAPEGFSELRVPKKPVEFREQVRLDDLYPPTAEGVWLTVSDIKSQRIFVNLEAVVDGRCLECGYERQVLGSQIMAAVQESSAGRRLSRAGNTLSHFGNVMTPGIGTMLAGRSARRVDADRETRGVVDMVNVCPNCGRGEVAYNVTA